MCELFGASVAAARGFARWLIPFRARGGEQADNPDGWGVASWQGGGLRIEKAPEPGARSPRFHWLARSLRAELVIAHVRKARHPPVPGLHNTHPFSHACCGREWVFAHNGLVPALAEQPPQGALCHPRGETDSEHAFCHLLTAIAACYENAAHGEWMQRLAQLAGGFARLGKFNFLLSDGEQLIAYGHDRLHYLEAPHGREGLAVVATEPVTPQDAWQPFAPGELRVYRSGRLAMAMTPEAMRAHTSDEMR